VGALDDQALSVPPGVPPQKQEDRHPLQTDLIHLGHVDHDVGHATVQ